MLSNKIPHSLLGEELYRSLRSTTPTGPLSSRYPEMTIEDAYNISKEFLKLRTTLDNEEVVGKKIGVTSDAVQKLLGVYQPDFGFLTDKMQVNNGTEIDISNNLIQPKAEAEIAFRLKSTLKGPGITRSDVLAATDSIMPCFEIVDSRIKDWEIKIQDTIADNASCGIYTLGNRNIDPEGIDLSEITVNVYKNGTLISTGRGREVQGNPLEAVAWLANTLGQFGIPLLANDIILSGSLVPLEPISPGDSFMMELVNLDASAELSFC